MINERDRPTTRYDRATRTSASGERRRGIGVATIVVACCSTAMACDAAGPGASKPLESTSRTNGALQPSSGAERADRVGSRPVGASRFLSYRAPAANLPATLAAIVDGRDTAVLPSGRLITPVGVEVNVGAPKPFGLALAPDGQTLATINSGASRFSVTLIRNLGGAAPAPTTVLLNATFMGVVFSPDSKLFFASGGENGNIWVGDVASGSIIGSVNLNGTSHPLDRPLAVLPDPVARFKGAFPGNMALSRDGRFLYVVDQASFQVHVVDTRGIVTGADAVGKIVEPDNFAAVIGRVKVGRYPFGLSLSADDRTLYVTNVGVFQYSHLRPEAPSGNANQDYPLCIPGVGYPDETGVDKTIRIKKIDASAISRLPLSQRDPEGIRCGYVPADITYTIPGLGSPNVAEASSVYVLDVAQPAAPAVKKVVKTGNLVGQWEDGVQTYSGSHPNAAVVGRDVYVANGNDDSISVMDRHSHRVTAEIDLSMLRGNDRHLRGVQPVSLAISPDNRFLYVAEAGLNAVGVIRLDCDQPRVEGHIPVGWWPSGVKVSADGKTLYVANAKGRGAGPNTTNSGPKHSTMGTVHIVSVPGEEQLAAYTRLVLRNNGFDDAGADSGARATGELGNPIPDRAGVASKRIKHVIFINKENVTHDLLLGDITATRRGQAVDGNPALSMGPTASPNQHELALSFAFGDNFFLEPTVSSDGHRWLTNTYTSEIEETHWPASYGGKRRDAGDNVEVIANYPGRLGFTDADGSPDPNDYNQHGGIYLQLARHGHSFVNFGNGFEFAIVDEDPQTEPTGIREHVNVPMEKVVRDNTDHLYPEYNTAIPDSPLPENPDRFNRFGRFRQVFENEYVDRQTGSCKLPAYVDLYYPNDHGGGANDINPGGPAWDYLRYVQDNDAAVGMTVDLISKSPCWKDTVIFVVEDDTQNGLDHVDGHRSIFLAISPWVKRQYVSKTHLSLASIFKTVDLILGMPPLNQYDAAATDLRDLFTGQPDFTPFDFRQPVFLAHAKPSWRRHTRGIDFRRPDNDEVKLRFAIMRSEGIPRRGRSVGRVVR